MVEDPETLELRLRRLLPRVQKPARYVGGELNQLLKEWHATPLRVALAFPDIYDLGMANSALPILYQLINGHPRMLAERAFVPWTDMEREMRASGLPLYSLESKHALRDFDVVGVTLPSELLYTNLLTLLDLAGLPLLAADRGEGDPLVIVGGHATFNPEPIADFVDACAIGEAEEVVIELCQALLAGKEQHRGREQRLRELARIDGVYVPRLYRPRYHADGTVAGVERLDEAAPLPVRKRIVAELPPPPARPIVPHVETVHDRVALEIMRGCTRGCRFCQAGIVTRPVRERSVEQIVSAVEQALDATGFDEVGLLSLSSSDYSRALELVQALRQRLAPRQVNISLPSLRIESFSVDLLDALAGASRRGGFTLAPEAATEQMRATINKPLPTAQVLETSAAIFRRGWRSIKLYFMIGHPTESDDDVRAIATLCRQVIDLGRAALGGRARLNVGVSTFVPKPHTPFQWTQCDTEQRVRQKVRLLARELRHRQIKLSWTEPTESLVEAWLARGDRRVGRVILAAWRRGARFDGWRECFRFDSWQAAWAEVGLDPAHFSHRPRTAEEIFPWDHIDCGVKKSFLLEDYRDSLAGRTRDDCRERCTSCGVIAAFRAQHRRRGASWCCPARDPADDPASASR